MKTFFALIGFCIAICCGYYSLKTEKITIDEIKRQIKEIGLENIFRLEKYTVNIQPNHRYADIVVEGELRGDSTMLQEKNIASYSFHVNFFVRENASPKMPIDLSDLVNEIPWNESRPQDVYEYLEKNNMRLYRLPGGKKVNMSILFVRDNKSWLLMENYPLAAR